MQTPFTSLPFSNADPSCRSLLLSTGLLALAAYGAMGTGCVNTIDPQSEHDGTAAFVGDGEGLRNTLTTDDDGWLLTPIIPTGDAPFSRVGFRFDASGPFEVEGRASYDNGENWMPWVPATVTYQDGIAHNAQVDGSFDGATEVQLRFMAPVEAQLSFLAVELFEVANDAERGIDLEAAGTAEQGLAGDTDVITRSQWGARPRNCGSFHTPNRLSIHHTDTPKNDTISMARRVRQIQAFHIDNRGWCDIGYHFLVGQDGKVYQGRYENKTGAHVRNHNTNNVGISFIGDYSSTIPSEAVLSAGANIIRKLAAQWNIPLDRAHVKGHREQGSTSCPGDQLYARISNLLSRAANGGAAPTPPAPAPEQPSTPVANPTAHFSDVDSNSFAANAIEAVTAAGIMDGCATDAFCPDQHLTRAEIAVIFDRLHDDVPVSSTPYFDDVSPSHPAYASIQRMRAMEITWGCSIDQFCPDQPVSRAAAAVFISRAKDIAQYSPANPTFVDVASNYWAGAAIEGLYRAGLVAGCANYPRAYCPTDVLTRAQAAVLIQRAYPDAQGTSSSDPVGASEPTPVSPGVGTANDPIVVNTFPFVDDNDTSTSASDLFDHYSCNNSLNESGPEVVYRVVLNQPGTLSAAITDNRPAGVDIDVHLLADVDEQTCIERNDSALSVELDAGEYLIVADTYVRSSGVAQSGAYELQIDFTP